MNATLQKKICMLGGFSVGKTSLVKRYVQSVFSETYLTTVGVKIDKKTVDLPERSVNLILWDLAGEDDIGSLRITYLRGAAGYVLVADGTRPATLDYGCRTSAVGESTRGPRRQVLTTVREEIEDRRVHRVRPFEKTQVAGVSDLPVLPIRKGGCHLGAEVRGHHDVIGETDHQHGCGDRPIGGQPVLLRPDTMLGTNSGSRLRWPHRESVDPVLNGAVIVQGLW